MNIVSLTYPAWNGNSTPRRLQGWSGWVGAIFALILVFPEPSAAAEPLDTLNELINAYRQQAGLPSLERVDKLDRAATRHNNDMAVEGFFAHCAPDGICLKDRLQSEGYEARLWAENLAAGQATPAQVLQAWDQSPDHRRNLRLEQATQIGLSILAHDNSAVPSPLWTVVFGHPR